MREILFRGKRGNEWVYGNLVILSDMPFITGGQEFMQRIEKDTLSQFTGLRDKNGKRIFEGDILRCAWETEIEVFWDEDYLQFRGRESKTYANAIDYYGLNKIEVIGNKWDNPELSKGE